MYRKKLFSLVAVIAVFALLLAGCGSDKANDAPADSQGSAAAEVLDLTDWELSASTWSSPNGATVHLSATPAGYAKGQTATFVVRLEGEDVESVPCEWDGKTYTASADLNGDDGYCYYVILAGADGKQTEIAVNVPTNPTDESLINLASSLNSFCSLIVESSDYDGSWLSITGGTIEIRTPLIRNGDKAITCTKATLVLNLDGQEVGRMDLELPEPDDDGKYTLPLTDIAFKAPSMEDDQQLSVSLEVTLSNDQTLSAEGGTWFYNAGGLMMSVG